MYIYLLNFRIFPLCILVSLVKMVYEMLQVLQVLLGINSYCASMSITKDFHYFWFIHNINKIYFKSMS